MAEPIPTTAEPITTTAEPTTTTVEPTTTTAGPTTTETSQGHETGDPVEAMAIADLATRLGVGHADIVVTLNEPVTWTDGSAGCPQPGLSYIQVLLDGVRIILEHQGVEYAYHQMDGQDPFLCEDPAAGGFVTPEG